MWELSAAICTSHYKTKTTIPGICTLTAVETAEHVYTECAAKHWAEQSVCTSLDEKHRNSLSFTWIQKCQSICVIFPWTEYTKSA